MSDGQNLNLTELREVVEDLRRTQGDDIAVVLIGSAARGVWTQVSDIDLILVADSQPRIAKRFSGYHIQAFSAEKFLRNLSAGEDLEAWCVRLGTTLYEKGIWTKIKQTPAVATWPKWQLKVVHGARRLLMAKILLETGDRSAAAEEIFHGLGHVARGILLRERIFPLSRAELPEQVRTIGYPHLAQIHEQLREAGDVPFRDLGLIQLYAKKLLCHLDRETYRTWAEDCGRRRKAKAARLASLR